ncbi:MAG: hypothetical protein K1060chlam5_01079 [Candidatus Anoxychlamydiales bacterium]|nr:hypothetical protein [Candidatus Anoxychlamydiales bacterium]
MRKYLSYICLFSFFINAYANPSSFHSFTGKITGNKVRVRTSADLDGKVVKQLNKNELVFVKKEANDFYAIKPFSTSKAYVYKNLIVDGVVDGNLVNIRFSPDLDSPVLGQLKKGDRVLGDVCEQNSKWYEIQIPDHISFYIAKEYITYAGDEKYYAQIEKKKSEVETLLNSAYFITQTEIKKPYDEMRPDQAIDQFDAIIKGYSDFPEHVKQAKEGLVLLQDNYLQKKIAYLEAKASISEMEKEELLLSIEKSNSPKIKRPVYTSIKSNKNLPEKLKFYQPLEESLYLTWTTFHPDKSIDDFYLEQEIDANTISGVIESYSHPIKNKPGNFIVSNGSKKAYLYSTKLDLDKYVGKKIKLKVSPRPNNNFAYPAYFVNSIE